MRKFISIFVVLLFFFLLFNSANAIPIQNIDLHDIQVVPVNTIVNSKFEDLKPVNTIEVPDDNDAGETRSSIPLDIYGRVTNIYGEGLEDVYVKVDGGNPNEGYCYIAFATVKTDADGNYHLGTLFDSYTDTCYVNLHFNKLGYAKEDIKLEINKHGDGVKVVNKQLDSNVKIVLSNANGIAMSGEVTVDGIKRTLDKGIAYFAVEPYSSFNVMFKPNDNSYKVINEDLFYNEVNKQKTFYLTAKKYVDLSIEEIKLDKTEIFEGDDIKVTAIVKNGDELTETAENLKATLSIQGYSCSFYGSKVQSIYNSRNSDYLYGGEEGKATFYIHAAKPGKCILTVTPSGKDSEDENEKVYTHSKSITITVKEKEVEEAQQTQEPQVEEPAYGGGISVEILSIKNNGLDTTIFNYGDELEAKILVKGKDGTPVKDALVYYYTSSGAKLSAGRTDENGIATINYEVRKYNPVGNWNFVILARYGDYESTAIKTLQITDEYDVEILTDGILDRGKASEIKIKVTDANGRFVNDASVYLYYEKEVEHSGYFNNPEFELDTDLDRRDNIVDVITSLPVRIVKVVMGTNMLANKPAAHVGYAKDKYTASVSAELIGDGVYSASIEPDYNIPSLVIRAEAYKQWNSGRYEKEFGLNGAADILNIQIKNLFVEKVNKGHEFTFSAIVTYPDGSDVKDGDFKASYLSSEVKLTKKYNGRWDGSITVPESLNDGDVFIFYVGGNDNYGNTGKSNEKTVIVSDEYQVNITSIPSHLIKGEKLEVRAEVRDVNGKLVDDANVEMILSNGETIIMNQEGNDYVGTYTTLPNDPDQLTVTVTAEKYGNHGEDSKIVDLSGSGLEVEILSPNDGDQFSAGDEITVRANITRSGQPVVCDVTFTIFGTTIVMSNVNGIYEGIYTVDNNDQIGTTTITVNAIDNYGNTGSGSVNVEIIQNQITANIYTNLTDEPNVNINQTYEIHVNVSNQVSSTLTSVNVTLDKMYDSDILTANSVIVGDLYPGDSKEAVFIVKAPHHTGYENWSAIIRYIDGGGIERTSVLKLTIYTREPAGGLDRELVITSISIVPNVINNSGMTAEVNVTVLNDGETNVTGLTFGKFNITASDGSVVSGEFLKSFPTPVDLGAGDTVELSATIAADNPNNLVSDVYTINITVFGFDLNEHSVVGSNEVSGTFYVDAKGPVISLLSSLVVQSGALAEFNVTDDIAGVDDVWYFDGSNNITMQNVAQDVYAIDTTGWIEGTYNVIIYANDTVGNENNSLVQIGTVQIIIDNTPPSVDLSVTDLVTGTTITSPAGGPTGPSAFLNATTDENTICRFGATQNPTQVMSNTGGTSHSQLLTNLPNGTVIYYVNCSDVAGNSNEVSITWNVDALGPNITLVSPSTGRISPGTPIVFNITDSSNVTAAWYHVNGVLINTITFAGNNNLETITIDTTGWTNGIYEVVVYANDTFGNENDTATQLGTLSFVIDNEGPTITLLAPQNDSAISSGTLINFTITDISGVDTAWYFDENSNITMQNTSLTDYYIDTTGWSEGVYDLIIYANDTIGNENNIKIRMTIDDTAPTLVIHSPNSSTWYNSLMEINVTATDNVEVAIVNATLYNSTWSETVALQNVGNWVEYYNTTTVADGTYNLTVVAYDVAGNSISGEVLDVMVDNTGPNVTIIEPLSGRYDVGELINVTANATDYGIGISNGTVCRVRFGTVYSADNLTYNNQTGQCTGEIRVPNSPGTVEFVVEVYDALGNIGSNSLSGQVVTVTVNRRTTGGGGGGGLGGGYVPKPPEQEVPIALDVQINPDSADILSNETAEFTVKVTNYGEENLTDLKLTILELPSSDYETDIDKFDLMAGESTFIKLSITPKSLDTGEYELRVRVGNYKSGASNVITLKVTNVESEALKAEAEKVCTDARAFIDDLIAKGEDATPYENSYNDAMRAIDEGNYQVAIDICNAIVETGTTGGGPGGITGLFIGIGEFVWDNWTWIIILTAVGLTLYLNRAKLISLFKRKKPPIKPESKEESEKSEEEKVSTEWELDWH